MGTYATWKLLTDIGLVMSLVYLCYRFMKMPAREVNNAQMMGLETSLKELIRSADNAGRSLNDQLLKRQSTLEKLLFDIQSAEQRLNSIVDASSEEKKSLETEIRNAKNIAQILAEDVSVLIQKDQGHARKSSFGTAPSSAGANSRANLDPESKTRSTPEPSASSAGAELGEAQEKNWGKVNIYGDPISAFDSPESVQASVASQAKPERNSSGTRGKSSLGTNIEKEISQSGYGASTREGVQEVYASAERLLRAGSDLKTVAHKTNLPLEEVEMMSQLVAREDEFEKEQADEATPDPRLGVLSGGVKRHRITV